ncbi:MAG TPA: CHAT domain-containing protein [Saprospiraceae bacterium]|nr:CHAT domain-containing protein [Saprospiraceae bacterium]
MRTRFSVLIFLFWFPGMTVNLSAQNFIYIDTLLPEDYKVYSLSVVDSQVMWATASKYDILQPDKDHLIKVLRTTDGGASWRVFDVPEARGRLAYTIAGRSPKEAWITTNDIGSSAGKGLLKTTDGGQSWVPALQHRAGGATLHFFDTQRIYCQNSYFLGHSADGGTTWEFDTLQFGPDEYIPLVSGNNSLGIAGDTVWAGTSAGRILRCTDYGKNCIFLEHNLLPDSLYHTSIVFSDHRNGWLPGGNYIYKTADGGLTWQTLENTPISNYYPTALPTEILMEFSKTGDQGITLWAIKSSGVIGSLFSSTNFGQTWRLRDIAGIMYSLDCSPKGQLWIAVRSNPRKYFEKFILQYINYVRHYYSDAYTGIFIYSAVEGSHSLSLLKERQQLKSLRNLDMPVTLIQQERQLRDSITMLKKISYETTENLRDTKTIGVDTASGVIERLQNQYATLILCLDSIYPEFQRNRMDLGVPVPSELQEKIILPGQAILEYFVTDSSVMLVTITKDTLSYVEIKKDFPLDQWVEEFRHNLTAFHTDPGQANNYDSLAAAYTALAYRLYEKLLSPIAASLPKHLIIVPDGALSFLPFEALLTALTAVPTRWQDHAYLLKKHSISYALSATMLREMTVHPHLHEPTVPFYGFAPRYDGDTTLLANLFAGADLRKDLQPLPHSGEEVYKAAKLMGGKYLTGKAASEANFRAKAPEARILHLATHARANAKTGDYSFLVFADQKDSAENEILYARDIYNLQLNADLVVLSACETGLGELQSSEGVISLARAFAYAGAKSIVTSLWSVSDSKTKDLMIDFYKNLRKGMLKDDALRQAKLDFLKRNRGQAAHPFYWAGFVGIGNMEKVK